MKINPQLKKEIKKIFWQRLEEEKKEKVVITTPYPLKGEEFQIFFRYLPWLRNKKIENQVNPNLIGGFILKIGSNVFDGSILGRLNQIISQFNQ